MKFWQQKWRSMNGFRRMILVVLALMLVGFGAAMAAAQTRLPFISDGEGRLTPKAEGETLVYSGQLDGGQVRLTVRPDGTAGVPVGNPDLRPLSAGGLPGGAGVQCSGGSDARGVTIRQGDGSCFGAAMTPRRKMCCSPWCPTAPPWQRGPGSQWRTPDSRSTPPGSSCCVRPP